VLDELAFEAHQVLRLEPELGGVSREARGGLPRLLPRPCIQSALLQHPDTLVEVVQPNLHRVSKFLL
jgi:hypothetical protein